MARPNSHEHRAPQEPKEFEEVVVEVCRVTRVVKGGRRLRFRALVVVGDRKGRVGAGVAKGLEVQTAVAKATLAAKKAMIKVPLTDKGSIPFEVTHTYGSSTVLIKPAGEGTSVIAGGAVRPVMALAGVHNVLSKNLGSNNKMNVVMATMGALKELSAYSA